MTSTHLDAFEAHRSNFRRRTTRERAFSAFTHAMHRAARSFADRHETRRAIEELQQLDERTLRDIGLTPSDIDPASIRATVTRFRGC